MCWSWWAAERRWVWFVAVTLWLLWALSCVTRTQVCVEAQHAAATTADWRRSDSVGASVCVDVERP